MEGIVKGFRGMRFVVLREIFGGRMGKLIRGWREFLMGYMGMGFVVHVVLRDIFGGEMEKLQGGWREL